MPANRPGLASLPAVTKSGWRSPRVIRRGRAASVAQVPLSAGYPGSEKLSAELTQTVPLDGANELPAGDVERFDHGPLSAGFGDDAHYTRPIAQQRPNRRAQRFSTTPRSLLFHTIYLYRHQTNCRTVVCLRPHRTRCYQAD